jgi:transcriptional regulator with XRE-family HTH domain
VFGRRLKRFRLRAGLERAEIGSRTGCSPSTIASYEQGRRVPPPRFIDMADELLDASGVLLEMKDEVARAQFPALKGATELTWVTSTYSSGEGGDCVEVATCSHTVRVRDSKDVARLGPAVGRNAWGTFVGYAVEGIR